jgi:hypothetical protein
MTMNFASGKQAFARESAGAEYSVETEPSPRIRVVSECVVKNAFRNWAFRISVLAPSRAVMKKFVSFGVE